MVTRSSGANYNVFNDDDSYIISVVCYYDPKKAKVELDVDKHALHVMGEPLAGWG